ncbi:MAG: ATP-binding protein [Cryomorphaceae bacterium]|nr:ATP-binding protein [Cryomorphaceae bacterium]
MIIQFSVSNYKLFLDKATLNMVASDYKDHCFLRENVFLPEGEKKPLVRSAVVYGANASGKSKLLEALVFMRQYAISSSKDGQKGDRIAVEPFRLGGHHEGFSEFEVIFVNHGTRYRYGFEVSSEKVNAEWLYMKPKAREIEIFYREGEHISTHAKRFTKGNLVVKEGLLRDNALLLSVAAQFNDAVCREVLDWFQQMEVIRDIRSRLFRENAIDKIKTNVGKSTFLDYLKKADMGISDLFIVPLEEGRRARESAEIMTVRKVYNEQGEEKKAVFSLNKDESEGTKKYFYLLGPVVDALHKGSVLLVDELDAKLHPHLVTMVVNLFHNKETNPNNAQLIFNTHSTHILHEGLFRPDQVWFTEKNHRGEARLYSLAEFKLIQANDYADRYLQGKFGAIPCLTDLMYG